MNPEQLLDQVSNVERAMAHCHYAAAETLLQRIHIYGHTQKARALRQIVSDAINEAKNHCILDVFRSLTKIRKVVEEGAEIL